MLHLNIMFCITVLLELRTKSHPDCESNQGQDAELEDEINVDGNGNCRDEG